MVAAVEARAASSGERRLNRARLLDAASPQQRLKRQRVYTIDIKSSASALPTLHVNSSDSNGARCVPIGTVERAFASVRIVEANVCKGGEWLVPPKVRSVHVMMRLLA
jgi:hypothetical protein